MFEIIAFLVIWGFTLGTTYWVWTTFGWLIGVLFFLFGAGLAGAFGLAILLAIAKLLKIEIEE